jgi:hypothetical protein
MATQRKGNGSNNYGDEAEGTQRRRLPTPRSLRDVMAQAQASRGDLDYGE